MVSTATDSVLPAKRKPDSPDSSNEDELEPTHQPHTSTGSTTGGAGSELVPNPRPGEPPVTKRTLQNRKAQREFRKRREARVKDLEERCRRFDQMGIEANSELQAIARRLKDENDALRGLLIRLGYGSLIQNALQELHPPFEQPGQMFMREDMPQHPLPPHAQGLPGNEHMQGPPQQQQQQPQQPQPHMMAQPQQRPPTSNVPSSAPATQTQFTNIQQPPGSVRPNELASSGMPAFGPQGDALAVRWTDEGNSTAPEPWMRSEAQSMPAIKRQRSATTGPTGGDDGSLLSINLPSRDGKGQTANTSEQQQPGLTPGTWNSLMGMINNVASGQSDQASVQQQQSPVRQQQQQQPQSAGGGSAFLKNLTPAHRPHQNDALLNPNPIPFALNFSNEPAPDQSWWDRNGGGTFGHDAFLDEKANAVAQAQVQASQHNGSQSPFDISAFLTTGTTPTPGGGLNFGGMPAGFTPALSSEVDPMSEAGARLKQGGKEIAKGSPSLSSATAKTSLTPAEHIQTFLRLLERRAIRAGEQRHDRRRQSQQQERQGPHGQQVTTWLDMGSDASSEDDNASQGSRSSRDRSMITPNSAYSRLAQHPIFLRTDARELEDMINSIDAARIATVAAQGSGSGAPLEVDAAAIDRLMRGLDRKLGRGGSMYRPVDASSLPVKTETM